MPDKVLAFYIRLSSEDRDLKTNTNMTRRPQSRKAELYEQYRAGRISREKFADIQKTVQRSWQDSQVELKRSSGFW